METLPLVSVLLEFLVARLYAQILHLVTKNVSALVEVYDVQTYMFARMFLCLSDTIILCAKYKTIQFHPAHF